MFLIYTQTILLTYFYFSFKVLLFCQISYQIVDAMIWLGIRDIINDFRKKKLKLRPVTYLKGSYSSPHDVPYGYLWSPHLVPKPKGHFYVFHLYMIAFFIKLLLQGIIVSPALISHIDHLKHHNKTNNIQEHIVLFVG